VSGTYQGTLCGGATASGEVDGITFYQKAPAGYAQYGVNGSITGNWVADEIDVNVTGAGNCSGPSQAQAGGHYHLTVCNAGYIASDGTCTPTCTISSFTSPGIGQLAWSVSGVPAASIQITQNSGSNFSPNPNSPNTLTGTMSSVPAGTYTLSSTAASCASSVTVVGTSTGLPPVASLSAAWTTPNNLPSGVTYTISPDGKTMTMTVPPGTQPFSITFHYFNNGESGSIVNVTKCDTTNHSIAVTSNCSGTLVAP